MGIRPQPKNGVMETLTIVIPALNEEQAVGSTIERCLAARSAICLEAGLDGLEIIVVSDGSTDRTVEVARQFDEIKLIAFPENRGYGAAIKAGFAAGSGSLVGFLDADGTCDPRFFIPLCCAVKDEGAEIALGSRLGPQSKMPRIRRLGNRIYAFLLGLLCGQQVTDTASGMRVIRRSALDLLYPLPNGLHFTPAMSARALLSGLTIKEVPMAYQERIGQSKLHVVRDGVRFLQTIFEGVLCYRPERLFLAAFTLCFLVAFFLAAYPAEFYLHEHRLEEWMIYRFIVCSLLGTAGFVLLAAGTLAHRIVVSGDERRAVARFWPSLFESIFSGWPLVVFVTSTAAISLGLVWPGIVEFVSTGHETLHWSRVMLAAFGLLIAFIACVTAVLLRVVVVRQRPKSEEVWQDEPLVRQTAQVDDEQLVTANH